jgi:hypothetical protein
MGDVSKGCPSTLFLSSAITSSFLIRSMRVLRALPSTLAPTLLPPLHKKIFTIPPLNLPRKEAGRDLFDVTQFRSKEPLRTDYFSPKPNKVVLFMCHIWVALRNLRNACVNPTRHLKKSLFFCRVLFNSTNFHQLSSV